jgi:hypothetical protein
MGKLRRVGVAVVLAGVGCATSGAESPPARAGAGASQNMGFGGGDGSSCEQAVVVHARGEMAGVRAEYDWLGAKFPGYARRSQSLSHCGDKPADILEIRTADGRTVEVYFDISEYFGQF